MPVIYANNASSTLASGINSSVTSITIGNWAASRFPTISAGSGDFFFATIEEGSTREIVRVTATNSGTSTLTVERGAESTTAAAFTTAATIQVRATAGMLDALGKTADIWEQTTPGTYTWTKPTGAKLVHVLLYGGGGGGGGGYRRSTSTISAASGGGGGAGGGRTEAWLPASLLPATMTAIVGSGGTAGAAATADNTNGGNGGSGGSSEFRSVNFSTDFQRIAAYGGYFGGGGGTTPPGGGFSTDQMFLTGQDNNILRNIGGSGMRGTGSDSVFSAQGGMNGVGPGGGGGGAGFDVSSTTSREGAKGGRGGRNLYWSATSDTTGGNTNSGAGQASMAYNYTGGSGGDGGANGSSANPKSGYAGGYPGGGGGGGGATTAANSGAGGAGANGFIRVTTFY